MEEIKLWNGQTFNYDEETHSGYVDKVLIPSITQLVGLLFPMPSGIKKEVLEKASSRGTDIHGGIDNYLKFGVEDEQKQVQDFINLTSVLGLKMVESEFLLLFTDNDNKVVAYGHADQLFKATKKVFGYLEENDYVLSDNKTVFAFDNKKVALQLNLYSTGYLPNGEKIKVDKLCGLWLRAEEESQYRPLEKKSEKDNRAILLNLVKEWEKIYE